MKKLIFAFFLVIIMIQPVCAQVSIGNRAGLSLFKSHYSETGEYEDLFMRNLTNTIGVSFAMPIEIMLGDHFALQPEVGYTMKGKRYGDERFGGYSRRLNYLDFTLLAKGRIGTGRLQGEVMLGPGLAYGLTVREISHNIGYAPYGYSYDLSYDFPSTFYAQTEIFMIGGAGVSYAIGVPRIFLNYRYVLGFSSIYEDDLVFTDITGATIREIKEYNRGSVISLGFLIPLSKNAWVPGEEIK